mgnify:CR=1 FL=1
MLQSKLQIIRLELWYCPLKYVEILINGSVIFFLFPACLKFLFFVRKKIKFQVNKSRLFPYDFVHALLQLKKKISFMQKKNACVHVFYWSYINATSPLEPNVGKWYMEVSACPFGLIWRSNQMWPRWGQSRWKAEILTIFRNYVTTSLCAH